MTATERMWWNRAHSVPLPLHGQLFDRANDGRRRGEELRTLAENMLTSAAHASLLDMAAALEHHAGNLEQTGSKFARARQAAAAVAHSRGSRTGATMARIGPIRSA